jgi:two-component system KDP operon response regulator KdpE
VSGRAGGGAGTGTGATRTEKLTVLVVDDDARLRALCEAALSPEYNVVLAENGKEGLSLFYSKRPDVVLLDVTMPVMDGWQTVQRMRDMADTPIIMVTALGADHDVARGLDLGADDFVTKPFKPVQLAARIRAVLRRAQRTVEEPGEISLRGGELVLDTARRAVVVRGSEVKLSATEYKILETLARHAGQVLTHDQILDQVWGFNYAGESGYVKTYVGLLRNKIEEDPRHPKIILSRRGFGYLLEARRAED